MAVHCWQSILRKQTLQSRQYANLMKFRYNESSAIPRSVSPTCSRMNPCSDRVASERTPLPTLPVGCSWGRACRPSPSFSSRVGYRRGEGRSTCVLPTGLGNFQGWSHLRLESHCPGFSPTGLKITPWLVLLFMITRIGVLNRIWRTHPSSSTDGCSVSHSQSTEPSPASGFTVK